MKLMAKVLSLTLASHKMTGGNLSFTLMAFPQIYQTVKGKPRFRKSGVSLFSDSVNRLLCFTQKLLVYKPNGEFG